MFVKLGIIGLGRMGKHHARIAQTIPNLTLFAIADRLDQPFFEFLPSSTIITKDYRDWLHLVNAVIIATPTQTHFQIAKDALSAGLHVLLEKPIAPTISEATELFNKAAQKNKILQIGQIERFNPAFVTYKKINTQKPIFIESQRKSVFLPHIVQDSVILDLMIHDIDLALQLIDSPVKSINIIGKKIYSSTTDISTAEIEFKNGSQAFFHASRIATHPKRIMNIHNKEQIFSLNFVAQSIHLYQGKNPLIQLPVQQQNGLFQEISHFINAIQLKEQQKNAEKDLASLELTLALQKKLML
jgi:predicted dehydrogenase